MMNSCESAYLEGATPTKFGPKPLKSERGPSFSNINLIMKHTDKYTLPFYHHHMQALGYYLLLPGDHL